MYNEFTWRDYVETAFPCELCGEPLYRIEPSTMVVCVSPLCDEAEPHYLVGGDE